jgi:hypothetical protein
MVKRTLENDAQSRGKVFCDMLNMDKGSDLDREMGRFVEDCKKLETVNFSRIPQGKIVQMGSTASGAYARVRAFLDGIRYRIVVFPGTEDGGSEGPSFGFHNADAPVGSFKTEDGIRLFRTVDSRPQRVLEVMEILKAGMIDRLRRCLNCTDWFYAERKDQKYCCTKCRRHAFNTSPEQRRANREYQKQRYWDGIERSERQKQIARGERPTFRVRRKSIAA